MLDEARNCSAFQRNGLLTGILVAVALYFAREIFIPLALAGLLSFLLAPAANRLEQLKFRRSLTTILLVFILVATSGGIGWVVFNQIYNLATELPNYQHNITEKIESLHLNSAGRLTATVNMLTAIGKQVLADAAGQEPALPTSARRIPRDNQSRPLPADKTKPPVPVKVEPLTKQ